MMHYVRFQLDDGQPDDDQPAFGLVFTYTPGGDDVAVVVSSLLECIAWLDDVLNAHERSVSALASEMVAVGAECLNGRPAELDGWMVTETGSIS